VANVGAWIGLAILEIFRLKFGALISCTAIGEAMILTCFIHIALAEYLIIPVIALIMGSSNLWGYFKCSREAKDQLQSMTTNIMTSAATSYMSNAMRGGNSAATAASAPRV
jgi:hypothetical protein